MESYSRRKLTKTTDRLNAFQGILSSYRARIDENPSTTVKYGVRSIPTMILFKNGEPADMKIGAGTPKAGLAKWLLSHAAPAHAA